MITLATTSKFLSKFRSTAIILVLVILGGLLLTGCNADTSSSPINNPDTLFNAEFLFENKTPYVGNNSNVVNLIDNLPYGEYRQKVQLQTKDQPYGVVVNYDLGLVNISLYGLEYDLYCNAAILLALIDNLDELTFIISHENNPTEYHFSREQVQQSFDLNLAEYSKSIDAFKDLLENLETGIPIFQLSASTVKFIYN